jgi:hypothetical protein
MMLTYENAKHAKTVQRNGLLGPIAQMAVAAATANQNRLSQRIFSPPFLGSFSDGDKCCFPAEAAAQIRLPPNGIPIHPSNSFPRVGLLLLSILNT